jgi:hypothetical protein
MDWGAAVSRSAGFALQLAATSASAFLDYLIGRLTGTPSLGIVCWAALILFTAAALEFCKDLTRDQNSTGASYTRRAAVIDLMRPVRGYRWSMVVRALIAAGFAGAAAYAFTLAIITFRFLAVYNGRPLGKNAPLDRTVITFVSNFQASAATAALIIGSLILAILLRSEILLPCGIALVSIANAILIGLPDKMLTGASAGFHSQVAYSLSAPDGWLFRLPVTDTMWGCLAPFGAGVAACWIVSGLVRS